MTEAVAPITDADLAAVVEAVGRMTPGEWHTVSRANCLGTWTVFIGPGEYASNQLCAVDRHDDAKAIALLRNHFAAIISRLERAEADIDPPVCRLQFPDGGVPGNAREAAEGWKRRYDEERARRERAEALLRPFANVTREIEPFVEDCVSTRIDGRRVPSRRRTPCIHGRNHAAESALAAKDAVIAELREVLRTLQWAGVSPMVGRYCPSCEMNPPTHSEDCSIVALLARTAPPEAKS